MIFNLSKNIYFLLKNSLFITKVVKKYGNNRLLNFNFIKFAVGNDNNKKINNIMTTKITDPKLDPEVQIEEALSSTEKFIQNNGKKFLTVLAVFVLIVGGYFGYQHSFKQPVEQEALAASYVAQQLFAGKNMEQALKGDATNLGFEALAEKYASTKIGNISNHYAGICYLNLGENEKALNSLLEYKHVAGGAAEIINAQNFGLTGDAYAQMKNNKSAIEYYKKASDIENSFSSPYYLKKMGVLLLATGDSKAAKESFEAIKVKYAGSFEARDIDKFIGQCI